MAITLRRVAKSASLAPPFRNPTEWFDALVSSTNNGVPWFQSGIPQCKYQQTLWFQPWFQSGANWISSIHSMVTTCFPLFFRGGGGFPLLALSEWLATLCRFKLVVKLVVRVPLLTCQRVDRSVSPFWVPSGFYGCVVFSPTTQGFCWHLLGFGAPIGLSAQEVYLQVSMGVS